MGSFTLTHWLVVATLAWFVYRLLRRRPGGAATPDARPWAVAVVGESFYRANLVRLFPPRSDDDDDTVDASAQLRLIDDNPHDDQAVAVMIKGLQVGHLSRGDARRYRRARGRNHSDLDVAALIWVPSRDDEHYSVSLEVRF